MRILFVLHTFPPESRGGTELHVQGIAGVLARDHEIRIFCREGDERAEHGILRHSDQEGLSVARFNNLYKDYESFESTWRHQGSHEAFVSELDDFQPDVVHFHHLTGLSMTLIEAVKRRGLPCIFSLHDFWTVCPRGQRLHPEGTICETIDRTRCHACLQDLWPGWFDDLDSSAESSPILQPWDEAMRYYLSLCDILLTPSSFHRDRMIETTGVDPRRFVALAHGLDHDMFQAPRDPAPTPRVIGYIGSVIPTKGVHLLIEAFNNLPGDFELEIWGSAPVWHDKGDYLAELKGMVEDPGRVRFMGSYENSQVPRILENMDILVVPSLWWETFSLTIREAMLAGVPVVASDLGAMREAIARSGAGCVFDTASPRALTRSIMRLVDDREFRIQCASRRLQVKTLQQNAADYLNLYHQAIRIAQERRNVIAVNKSSFPKKQTETAGQAPARDLRVSIEKVGGGDVKVQSAVKRGDKTQVSFVLDYGPSDESSEVHLTVDFAGAESDKPAAGAPTAEQAPELPAEVRSASEPAVSAQTPEVEAKAAEEAMYKVDQESFPKQVEALDAMVSVTHLPEGDQQIGGDEKRERRPRRSRRDREERNERRPRRSEGDDSREDSRRERPERSRRRQDDERPRRRDEGDRPRRERRARRDEDGDNRRRREERPRRNRDEARPARSEKAAPKKPEAKEEPKPKKLTHDKGEVVWGGEAGWKLPESSASAPGAKPERAPHHRTGRQPNVKSSDGDSGFGEGV